MDKQERLERRRDLSKMKKEEYRKNNILLEYFNTKYPVIYQEAMKFYLHLNQQYSTIKDLRKTPGFKHFKVSTVSTDTMLLEIPLSEGTKTKAKETEQNVEMTKAKETEQNVEFCFPDLEMNDLLPEVPQQIVDEIITGLRTDPELRTLMDEFEDLIDTDIDVHIDDDERLEDELSW